MGMQCESATLPDAVSPFFRTSAMVTGRFIRTGTLTGTGTLTLTGTKRLGRPDVTSKDEVRRPAICTSSDLTGGDVCLRDYGRVHCF